jgi:hypothetical protein
MTIVQIAIPQNSLIEKSLPKTDYADCFLAELVSDETIQLENVIRYFLNQSPAWSKALMKIRDILVKPFGLKTDSEHLPVINISKGGTVSVFEVLEINDEEALLYATDKHLEACLSISINRVQNRYEISISTTVHFRNIWGHVYFFFVKPFHIMIVKAMLSKMANHFSKPIKHK